jgi:hypothetical protein
MRAGNLHIYAPSRLAAAVGHRPGLGSLAKVQSGRQQSVSTMTRTRICLWRSLHSARRPGTSGVV